MNTIKLIPILSLLFLAVSCHSETKTTNETSTETNIFSGKNRVEILDFYGTHRCKTCIAIEENTLYTLDIAFKEQVANGTVVFKLINFDDEKNIDIVTEYGAYGTSLFFNIVKDGKEEHIDLSEFAFKMGNEKVEYSMELEAKINEALAKL